MCELSINRHSVTSLNERAWLIAFHLISSNKIIVNVQNWSVSLGYRKQTKHCKTKARWSINFVMMPHCEIWQNVPFFYGFRHSGSLFVIITFRRLGDTRNFITPHTIFAQCTLSGINCGLGRREELLPLPPPPLKKMSRNISVRRSRPDDRGNVVWSPVEARDFPVLPTMQTDWAAHPASYYSASTGLRSSPPPPSGERVRNEWNSTCTFPYAFMAHTGTLSLRLRLCI